MINVHLLKDATYKVFKGEAFSFKIFLQSTSLFHGQVQIHAGLTEIIVTLKGTPNQVCSMETGDATYAQASTGQVNTIQVSVSAIKSALLTEGQHVFTCSVIVDGLKTIFEGKLPIIVLPKSL